MENSKELLENIIRSVVECTFSKITAFIPSVLTLTISSLLKPNTSAIYSGISINLRDKSSFISTSILFENVKILVNKDIVKKKFFINLNEARAANLENEFIVEILKEEHINLNKKTKDEISYKFEKEGIYTKLI